MTRVFPVSAPHCKAHHGGPITNLTKASELVPPWPSPAPAGSNRETAAPRNKGGPPRMSAATCQAPLPALCPRPVAWTTRHPGPGQMWALGPRGSFLQTQGKEGWGDCWGSRPPLAHPHHQQATGSPAHEKPTAPYLLSKGSQTRAGRFRDLGHQPTSALGETRWFPSE